MGSEPITTLIGMFALDREVFEKWEKGGERILHNEMDDPSYLGGHFTVLPTTPELDSRKLHNFVTNCTFSQLLHDIKLSNIEDSISYVFHIFYYCHFLTFLFLNKL
jgi:hypothetical protein